MSHLQLPSGRMIVNGHSVRAGWCVFKVWTDHELVQYLHELDAVDRPPRYFLSLERAKRFCARWNGMFGWAAAQSREAQ